jgi:hypothetical protein
LVPNILFTHSNFPFEFEPEDYGRFARSSDPGQEKCFAGFVEERTDSEDDRLF